jgi:hypothetical protein
MVARIVAAVVFPAPPFGLENAITSPSKQRPRAVAHQALQHAIENADAFVDEFLARGA